MSAPAFRLLLAVLVCAGGIPFTSSSPAQTKTDDKKPADDPRKATDAAAAEIKRVAAAKRQDDYLKEQQREKRIAVGIEQDRVLLMPSKDVEYPANWRKLSEQRQAIKMTEKEKKILKALDTPLDVDLPDSTLETVIAYLQDKSGVPIVVPDVVLEEKGITYKAPVSLTLKKVTLRTALKKVLNEVGLVYVLDKETLQVTTEERASKTLTTRTYYIGDLFLLQGQRPGQVRNLTDMLRAVNDIIGVIVGTVEPKSWWLNGGEGTIAFDPAHMTLIVRQTAEIHYMLGLTGGR